LRLSNFFLSTYNRYQTRNH